LNVRIQLDSLSDDPTICPHTLEHSLRLAVFVAQRHLAHDESQNQIKKN